MIVKKGKYGGTYAHKDIAFEFGSAISVAFKLYLIKEFQRLKEVEQQQLGWTAQLKLKIRTWQHSLLRPSMKIFYQII